jgi:mannosyltransferase
LIVMLCGTWLLRMADLGGRSLWTDEGSTWTAARAPLGELIRLCAQKDASPPLYYLMTALVLRLGESEAHLRFISTLASVGLVWMTYRIARLVTGRNEAMLAAAVIAVSPYQQLYAQEARTYATVAFLSVAAFYLFLRAVVFHRPRAWLPYIVVSALAMYTQNLAVLGVGVQGAVVLLFPEARKQMWRWVGAQALVVVLYLPWLFISMRQMSHLGSSHWYVRIPNAEGTFRVLRNLVLSPVPLVTAAPGAPWPGLDAFLPRRFAQVLLAAIPLVPLAWSVRGAFERNPRGFMTRVAWVALVAPLVAVFAVSFKTSLWLPRYFVFLSPFVALLTARGLAILKPPLLSGVWSALVLILGGYSCLRVQTDWTKEPWRDVVRHIAQHVREGRTAVLVPFDVDPFRFYNAKLGDPMDAFEVSHPDVPFASDYTLKQLEDMERMALERTRDYPQVWVVVRSPNSSVRREVALRTEHAAGTGRIEGEREKWDATGGPLRVVRYVRR